METKKQGICTTCHYSRSCSIKTVGAPSWECSEYEPSRVFLNQSPVYHSNPVSNIRSAEIKGLCTSCESVASCQWIQPDAVIFHCEHYQ